MREGVERRGRGVVLRDSTADSGVSVYKKYQARRTKKMYEQTATYAPRYRRYSSPPPLHPTSLMKLSLFPPNSST